MAEESRTSSLLSLLAPEEEPVRIKDKGAPSVKQENIELRHEINVALGKVQVNFAHRLNGSIHYNANQFEMLNIKITDIAKLTSNLASMDVKSINEIVSTFKKHNKMTSTIKSETIKTIIKYGIAGIIIVISAGFTSIILGIKIGQ